MALTCLDIYENMEKIRLMMKIVFTNMPNFDYKLIKELLNKI